MWRRTASYLTLGLITACAGGGMQTPIPHAPGGTAPRTTVFDQSTSRCAVSYDGLLWYTVPAGSFSPIDDPSFEVRGHCLIFQHVATPPNLVHPTRTNSDPFRRHVPATRLLGWGHAEHCGRGSPA